MSNRAVIVVFAACLVIAGAWAGLAACSSAQEDACSSTGSLLVFVALVGTILSIAVTVVLAAAVKIATAARRRH